ncbi:hypothetical protein L218DRAFT_1063155, partial [Marasmius fiardii PR-910]
GTPSTLLFHTTEERALSFPPFSLRTSQHFNKTFNPLNTPSYLSTRFTPLIVVDAKMSTQTKHIQGNKKNLKPSYEEIRVALEAQQMRQDLEDMKPYVFPEVYDRVLDRTFEDVKVEVYPLDGLHWTEEQLATQGGGQSITSTTEPPLWSPFCRTLWPSQKQNFPRMLSRSQSEPSISLTTRALNPSKENVDSTVKSLPLREKTASTPSLPSYFSADLGKSSNKDTRDAGSETGMSYATNDEFLYDEEDLPTPTVSTYARSDGSCESLMFLEGTNVDSLESDPTHSPRCSTPVPFDSSESHVDVELKPSDMFALVSPRRAHDGGGGKQSKK